MDAGLELARERAVLARAEADLREGEARVERQERLVADLRAKGQTAREAERLLEVFRATLAQWREHHVLIVGRIAHLEAELPSAAPVPVAPDGGALA